MINAWHYTTAIVNCPVCNSVISFASTGANIKICAVCNSGLERSEAGGPPKVLYLYVAPKWHPGVVQTGTKGVYKNKTFEIIGCVHCDLDGYPMRRWSVMWTDGTVGLFVETTGFFAMYERVLPDFPSRLPTVKDTPIGIELVELQKSIPCRIFDKRQCKKVLIEGEVFLADADGVFEVVEMGQMNGERFEFNMLTTNVFELYHIDYVGLHELSLTDLQPPQPRQHSCPKCSHSITLKVEQDAKFCVCSNCNGQIEITTTGELKYLKQNTSTYTFALPIGTKGTIHSASYEVVGATVKQESGSADIFWREYTLYDAVTGYAFLAEYNGHWTFLKEIKMNAPWPQFQTDLYIDDEPYVLFNDYSFRIVAAAGEFFTSFDTSTIMAREYISPPEMYLAENDTQSITWYKSAHISNTAVFEGLNLVDKNMPAVYGVGPLQPQKFSINLGLLARMCGVIGFVFLAVQIFMSSKSKEQTVYQQNFFVPDSLVSRGLTSQPFQLTAASSNVEITLSAPVDNGWFSASVTMVNEKTGTEYSFEKGVEYYHGYTDGENWAEGSREGDELLSSVPAGVYHLNIFPTFEPGKNVSEFSIRVVNDVPMWRNFFIVLAFVSIFPIISWWRTQTFEKKRWDNSDHNPYLKEDDES